jgi:Arc/MetJ-type ribon-helix-helix transcriptional regulator
VTQLRIVGDSGDDGGNKKQGPGRPAAPEFDPWDTDGGHSYSPTEFYTRSTNKFDHSKDVRAGIPPTIHSQLQSLVESKKFGQYRSIADIVRDSLVHRLRTIGGWLQDEELAKVLTIEERVCLAEADEAEVDAIESLLIQYTNAMERYAKNSDITRLSKKVAEVEDWAFYLSHPYVEQAEALAGRYRIELKRLQEK